MKLLDCAKHMEYTQQLWDMGTIIIAIFKFRWV